MAHVHSGLIDDTGEDACARGDALDLYACMQAVLQGKVSTLRVVEEALEGGASPEYWRGPQTPLRCAVDAGHTRLISLLLHYRAHPDMRDEKGVSALHAATFDAKTECIRILLNGQADPNIRDRCGQTPLFFAPTRLCCELLMAGRADVNVRNHKKQLALHFAAYNGLGQAAVCIAKRMGGSDERVEDHKGLSPMHYATHSKTKTALNLLQHHKADEVIQSLEDGSLPKINTEPTIKELIMLQTQQMWQNSSYPGEDTDAEPTVEEEAQLLGSGSTSRKAEQSTSASEMRYTEATDASAMGWDTWGGEEETAAAIDTSLGAGLREQAGDAVDVRDSYAAPECQAGDAVDVRDSYAAPECQAAAFDGSYEEDMAGERPHAKGSARTSESASEIWACSSGAHVTAEAKQRLELQQQQQQQQPLVEHGDEPDEPEPPVEPEPKFRLDEFVRGLGSERSAVVEVSDWRGCLIWDVVLEKSSEEDKFGMQVSNGRVEFEARLTRDCEADSSDEFLPGPELLMVRKVSAGGLLDEWNKRHPDNEVRPQDRICGINGTITVENMNTELRSRRRIKMQVLRYPERFLIQLHKHSESDRLGFRFANPQKSETGPATDVRIAKLLSSGLVAEHNEHQVMLGNWHYVVMPNMFIEAVNGISDDAEAIVEELKSAQTFVLTVRRAERPPPTPQQVQAGLKVVGKFLALAKSKRGTESSGEGSPASGPSSSQQVIGKAIGKFKRLREGGARAAEGPSAQQVGEPGGREDAAPVEQPAAFPQEEPQVEMLMGTVLSDEEEAQEVCEHVLAATYIEFPLPPEGGIDIYQEAEAQQTMDPSSSAASPAVGEEDDATSALMPPQVEHEMVGPSCTHGASGDPTAPSIEEQEVSADAVAPSENVVDAGTAPAVSAGGVAGAS